VLAQGFLATLQDQAVDYTQAFRGLADMVETPGGPDAEALRARFSDTSALDTWLSRWHARQGQDPMPAVQRAQAMRQVNPAYIPRNHRVEEALAAAVERGDYAPFERLLAVLSRPFDAQADFAAYAEPAPAAMQQGYRTFCGT
jgi:uncharacterized protein YdiU (UPF0061 family)